VILRAREAACRDRVRAEEHVIDARGVVQSVRVLPSESAGCSGDMEQRMVRIVLKQIATIAIEDGSEKGRLKIVASIDSLRVARRVSLRGPSGSATQLVARGDRIATQAPRKRRLR
jgi:hypothetical protein